MRPKEDTYKHKGLRKKLIELIEKKGIQSKDVLEAMNEIPRHFFLDSAFEHIAYEDRAFPIEVGQTISQPYTVAYQTHLLDVKPQMKILEIGTGSAYQACVLAKLKAFVYTIERQKVIFENNKKFDFLKQFYNIKFFYGDGFEGLPTFGPFDRILITAAAPIIPPKLLQQLKIGGYIVLPLDNGDQQTMIRVKKNTDGNFETETFENFSFVPMLTGKSS